MLNNFIYLLFFFSACSQDPSIVPKSQSLKTKHVFILVMDGARYSETWGDSTKQFIPYIRQLSKQGTIGTNFYNDGATLTIPGHTALTTGNYQEMNNTGAESPKEASIFQLYLSQKARSETDAWIFSSKDKLGVLADCTNPKWSGVFKPQSDCGVNGNGTGYREDSVTYKHLTDTLNKYHPHLALVNFKNPDATAHANDWQGYLNQIKIIDAYINSFWNYLQSDSIYAGSTTLFVTNDHGRHLDTIADGFVSHGDACEGCRHILFLALGPDFKKDYIEHNHYSLVDIYRTTCFVLGIEPLNKNGKVMNTIFKK